MKQLLISTFLALLVYKSLLGAHPYTRSLNGIDVLQREQYVLLQGKKIGLITNHSGQNKDGIPTIDLIAQAKGITLVALFSPEHGIRGEADSDVGDSVDAKTHLPVYSLYRAAPKRLPNQSNNDYQEMIMRSRGPQLSQLESIDALVFDIQDIGARFYTYAATLKASLQAASEAHKDFYVLDRINPISGLFVEGPVLTDPINFIGFHHVPIRHGMTLGELAQMMNSECHLGVRLKVISCENWTRSMWFDQTGLPWKDPSPAIKTLNAAILYPGLCLMEGTSVSLGRGTTQPFEQIGAPYIDAKALTQALTTLQLPGLAFEAVHFTPTDTLYRGPKTNLKLRNTPCNGVRIIITDRNKCRSIDLGIHVILELEKLYPESFKLSSIERFLGDQKTFDLISSGKSITEIYSSFSKELEAFNKRRIQYLLYPN